MKDSITEFGRDLATWKRLGVVLQILSAPFFFSYLITRLLVFGLARVIIYSLLWLFVAFGWIYRRLYKSGSGYLMRSARRMGDSFRRIINVVIDNYALSLKVILDNKYKILAVVLVLCLISFGILLPKLGAELIPRFSQGTFNLEFTLPVGTRLERTATLVGPIEQKIKDMQGVKKVSSRIGGDLLTAENTTQGANSAVVTVMLDPGGDLDLREDGIVDAVRSQVNDVPDLEMLVTYPTLFTFKQPIEVIVKGNQLAEVRWRGLEIENRLKALPIFADVESTVRPGHPEVVISFDRDRLANLGITAREAAERVKAAVLGSVPTRFREEERRIDIRVQMDEKDLTSISRLQQLVINPDQSIPVTLADVSELEMLEGPSEIKRVGGVRAAVVTADVIAADLKYANEVIRRELSDMNLIEGYDYFISGQHAEMKGSLASLRFTLLLAVFLVYVVMASQFESLKHPFIILLTIPLALAFVIPALWGLQLPLSVMVFLGLIVLAGVVVNDSIILVDYTNQLRRDGWEVNEAIVEAGRARFRPILMTTLTTVLALLPMALGVGEGVEIRRPMAVTLIFGLSFGTLITLVVIPVLYKLLTRSGVSLK